LCFIAFDASGDADEGHLPGRTEMLTRASGLWHKVYASYMRPQNLIIGRTYKITNTVG
jgi:hypothetical protein